MANAWVDGAWAVGAWADGAWGEEHVGTEITSAANGFYDVGATWVGGVVPQDGDNIVVLHNVTVRDTRTVGHSPGAADGTKAILVTSGSLKIAGGGLLRVRGDIGLDGGGFIMESGAVVPGAILEFDASQAGTPATALYTLAPINFNPGNGTIRITGSIGNRATVRSNAGGGNGRISAAEGLDIIVHQCGFTSIGDSTHPAVFGANVNGGDSFHFENCTFDDDCGTIGSVAGTGAIAGNDVKFINVTHYGPASVAMPSENPTTGLRIMSGCRWAGTVLLYRVDDYQISDTMFRELWDFTGGAWASFTDTLVAPPTTFNDFTTPGAVLRSYVARVPTTNQHGFSTGDLTTDLEDIIFDMPDGDVSAGAGDCITFNAPSAPQTINVRRCMVLPTESGSDPGSQISCLGGANLTLNIEHCTFHAGLGIYVGETYGGHAGMIGVARSNLAFNAVAGQALIINAEAGIALDVVASADADYNGVQNPNGDGYSDNLSFSSGTPGAHDISGDPEFVDRTRNIKKWDLHLGGPGTMAHALDEIMKKNDADGYDARYTITALRDWVRAGFVVRNDAMRVGAHDGTVMGAVQDEVASGEGGNGWGLWAPRWGRPFRWFHWMSHS